MRIGSLFSGIGGLEFGLEQAGLGPVVWQVEKNPFRRLVLAKHWPDVERFANVETVGSANLVPVDLLCGGFPCSDVSSAGGRAGLAGERSGLWRQFARIAAELRPEWCVVENVTSGATLWLDVVVRDLEQLGYACLPLPISASDLGAPHQRARIFVVAHTHREREHARAKHAEVAATQETPSDADSEALRLERWREGGQDGKGAAESGVDGNTTLADVDGARLEGNRTGAQAGRSGSPRHPWGPPVPDLLRMADGVSARLERSRPRIEALGDAVVPACAEVVGWVIRELCDALDRDR